MEVQFDGSGVAFDESGASYKFLLERLMQMELDGVGRKWSWIEVEMELDGGKIGWR